jgi:alpha-methylacyl-CoA racemase
MSPLEGLRVVELAAIGPVPYAGMLLADLGAEVVRIDRADGVRPFAAWHRGLERRRRRIALDLKHPDGLAALLRIIEDCDVLLEGFRPGVAERLGFGPDACHQINPGLIYGRMTGWGQRGPLAHTPGHDINYLALSGALDAIGPEGGDPVVPLNLVGDFAGGSLPLVAGVLAAVIERQRTGKGRVIDAAIVDGTASLLTMLAAMENAGLWSRGRGRNLLDGGAPFYTVYTCADGRHVAVGALEERFYLEFVLGLGLDPDLLPDRDEPANWPRLRRIFALRFAGAARDAWAARFEGSAACVTPVLSLAEAAEHPHHRARGTYTRDDAGALWPAPAPRFLDDLPAREAAVGEP